ncbi:uncharacterized protein LAJ45_05624 [Morchella importuna]|uniref:uncharacterized protein n=1 Tax=Morchella importuna TaxID=1174673 RepID=UPI001E8CC712|nr:uncharacterized protein LAJ45_05624 [Morchella importuna]KAH8150413.1 hypothetical protein LAJ45_05624 [Morchella importuna]
MSQWQEYVDGMDSETSGRIFQLQHPADKIASGPIIQKTPVHRLSSSLKPCERVYLSVSEFESRPIAML